MTSMEKLLTVNETLQALRISRKTLWRYMHDGLLPSYKLRGSRKFKASDIEKFINKNLEKNVDKK